MAGCWGRTLEIDQGGEMSLKNVINTAKANTKRSAPVAKGDASTRSLDSITPRATDTRPLNPAHVDDLMGSIGALGLIEPLAVDIKGRLLAGGHRLAAITQLREQQPAIFRMQFPGEMVPVRVMNFDAELDPAQALNIEIAENEQRRDYTPAEVRAIAERLKSEGYTHVRGRPKEGEKALAPALQIIIGKSRRTVVSYLAGDDEKPERPLNAQRCAYLKRALRELEAWENAADELGANGAKLMGQLPKLKKLLQAAISEAE
jgi:ParB family transcriptional regulator, chromosome partitioning protein